MSDTIYGWKMLGPDLCTVRGGISYPYPAPSPGQKWSEWMIHPEPSKADGRDCGPGGYHIITTKGPDARYAPDNWYPWFAQGRVILGMTKEKARVVEIRLRRVSVKTFHRIIRLGWCMEANLSEANLRWANLNGANLSRANLRWANLSRANLSEANLRWANLRWANLTGADLSEANLSDANLNGANLSDANLSDANLAYAIGIKDRD